MRRREKQTNHNHHLGGPKFLHFLNLYRSKRTRLTRLYMSAGVIISLILAIVLLFVSMVLSAMSANAKDSKDSHKYSTASAVVCGLSVLVLVVVIIIYHQHEKILDMSIAKLQAARGLAPPAV